MALSNYVLPIPLAAFASSGMGAGYQVISAAGGIPHAVFLLKILNNSTMDVTISYDGTNDHDYVPAGSFVLFDLQSNASPNNVWAWLRQGTKIYAKGTAGTGNLYISGWYQPQLV